MDTVSGQKEGTAVTGGESEDGLRKNGAGVNKGGGGKSDPVGTACWGSKSKTAKTEEQKRTLY